MTTETRNKYLYWAFKVGDIIVSCLIPIFAICEKFPIWTATHGTDRSIGVGAILILFVVAVIFRKSVFKFIEDKFKLNHAPPLAVWLALLVASYILIYIGSFLRDLTVVLWMGMIGCAIGTVLTYVAENYFAPKEADNDGNGN